MEGRFRQRNQTYVGRDRFETITPNPVKQVSEEPVSTFSIDVDTAAYAFVRRALNSGVLPQKNAVRIEELVNYFDYDYPLPKDQSVPFKATVSVFPTPWTLDTKLLHIGIKGFDVEPVKKPRANLVFLIDVSGSMESPDKLPLLKNAFRMLVETLDSNDSVAIVVYAGAAGTVLEPTPVKDKGKILANLDRLTAGGSTAGGEGIRQAYALAEANFDPESVNRVILATDGSKYSYSAVRSLLELPLPGQIQIFLVTVVQSCMAALIKTPTLDLETNRQILEDLQTREEDTARSLLEDTEKYFKQKGCKVSTLILRGEPAEEILQAAESINPELIVVGAKGLTGIKAFLLGSVSQRVARHSRGSVLIARKPANSVEIDPV